MNAKQQFLDQLRTNLRRYPSGAVDDYIDYYDELISEHVADGQKEAEAVRQLGDPKHIAASFKQDNAIDAAVKKPTVSNGLKALIAVLGVLSLPLLIPVIALLGVLALVGVVLTGAGCAVLVSVIITAILSVFDMATAVAAGEAPFYLLLLTIGAALIVLVLAFELLRGVVVLVKKTFRALITKLDTRRAKKKQSSTKNREEQ